MTPDTNPDATPNATQDPALAQLVRDHLTEHGPRLGACTLVCIDGPSGSGKTTLAAALGELSAATVLHTDAYCPGWNGVPEIPRILFDLLAPLTEGSSGQVQEWDWHAGAPGALRTVAPAPLIVVEGVGAGALRLAPWITTLVHLDADPDHRRARALERDAYFHEHWDAWAAAEEAYFAENAVRERADLTFRTR